MSNSFFDHPILNSSYSRPDKHWELDSQRQLTRKVIEKRRRAESGNLRPYLAKVTHPGFPGGVGESLVLRNTAPMILPEYLEQKLRSNQFIDLINNSKCGAKVPRADWGFVGNVTIVCPLTDLEQYAILPRTSEQTPLLIATMERAQRKNDLIREYRVPLFTDVVTGKLAWRHLASPRGDETLGAIEEYDTEKPLDDELDGAEDRENAEGSSELEELYRCTQL